MKELFETSNQIYMEVFGEHLGEGSFKVDKLQEINDWLEAGDPGRMTVAELTEAWIKHDSDVAWYGSDPVWSAKATKPDKNSLYRFMLTGDCIRRFGQFMSGDDALDGGARFAEFAKSQPLSAKWGYAEFAGWMIEAHPDEVEMWLGGDIWKRAMTEGLKPRPGQKVAVTVDGRRTEGQLLHPEKPGCPDGPWVVLFAGGMAEVFGQEEMEARRGC